MRTKLQLEINCPFCPELVRAVSIVAAHNTGEKEYRAYTITKELCKGSEMMNAFIVSENKVVLWNRENVAQDFSVKIIFDEIELARKAAKEIAEEVFETSFPGLTYNPQKFIAPVIR